MCFYLFIFILIPATDNHPPGLVSPLPLLPLTNVMWPWKNEKKLKVELYKRGRNIQFYDNLNRNLFAHIHTQ
jgi:hypothetical protein